MQKFMKKGRVSYLWIVIGLLLLSACKGDDEIEKLKNSAGFNELSSELKALAKARIERLKQKKYLGITALILRKTDLSS